MLAELILWIYGSREFIGFQFSVPRVSSAWIISVPIVCVKKWQRNTRKRKEIWDVRAGVKKINVPKDWRVCF